MVMHGWVPARVMSSYPKCENCQHDEHGLPCVAVARIKGREIIHCGCEGLGAQFKETR